MLKSLTVQSPSGLRVQNVIGLGLSDTIATSGGSGDDTFIITRFQYGTLEIQDGLTSLNGQNLIKFDYGVTITAYREVSFTVFNDVIVDSVALTLSTGAVVTIVLPAGSFGYQLGSGDVLTYADFKTAIGATGASDLAGDFTISASSVRFDMVPVHNATTHPLTDGATPTTNAVVIPNTAISAMGGTGKIVYSIDRAISVGASAFQINPNDGRLLVSEDHSAAWILKPPRAMRL